ncbi:MAG: hypothetical protein OEZ36_06755 [Spirochaetota bacterium]|nr:hypothetical protein [Spirochaetota bacterium]
MRSKSLSDHAEAAEVKENYSWLIAPEYDGIHRLARYLDGFQDMNSLFKTNDLLWLTADYSKDFSYIIRISR